MIVIGSDHGGLVLKEALTRLLTGRNIQVTNVGTNNGDSVDYPQFGLKVAEKFGIWPGATTENVTLENAITLLILVAGLPISVLAFAAAILMRRRWREALPLWFLAAGFGVALVAIWHVHLEKYAYLALSLFGLTATCVGCIVGMPRLVSFLTRYSS